MKTLHFKKEPSFAELWDACLYNLLYNEKEHTQEIVDLFKTLDITPSSKLIDLSAGTGFIALHLREKGYNIDCMDLMQDEIDVFKKKAKKMNIDASIEKLAWKDIFDIFPKENYDFAFCRGNSFIYASGGWNEENSINKERCLKDYKDTLQNFYDTLKPGGYLYLDKFKDNETPHRDTVAKVAVAGGGRKI